MSSSTQQTSHHPYQAQHPSHSSSHHQYPSVGSAVAGSSSHSGKHSSTGNRTALTGSLSHLHSFADERKDVVALPKIETDAMSVTSSHPSSPYSSPHLAPRARLGAMDVMEEITLPPIQAAVPVRRGAVSGASSGPSLPFPPIRLSFDEENIPSRGPSPTLGKRGSFSMGHSNHVPPGPDVHLPTPVLSGSGERRGGIATSTGYPVSQSLFHGDGPSVDVSRSGGVRMSEDSHSHFPSNATLRSGLPWSMQHKATASYKPENVEATPPPPAAPHHSMYTSHSIPPSNVPAYRSGHFKDDYQYPYSHGRLPHPAQHHPYEDQSRSSSSGYRNDLHHREDTAMSSGSIHSIMQGETSLSPRTNQSHLLRDDSQGQDMDMDAILIGKRPRSAPRVMSAQPRIFACTQCPARFARNHDLKRHQRGHLSVRPYPCQWCGKSFSRKDALKRHILVKGCGKNAKGAGGGKGGEKGKRSRGNDGEQRLHQKEHSGDQEDGQFGEEDDQEDEGSEENQEGMDESGFTKGGAQRWNLQSVGEDRPFEEIRGGHVSALPYYPVRGEHSETNKDMSSYVAGSDDKNNDDNNNKNNNATHSTMSTYYRRPSTSVA
ncbi:hypothetical protein CBS101457_004534 [Exobasidium rhododendri]|nr:hypothetical protein CBS101457_004534 [Exobasidium rhododendri]